MKSEKYKAWIRTLDCCMCGIPGPGLDPHHIKVVGNLSGAGMTAGDQFTMPLCRGCHNQMHADPDLWPDQWLYLARTLKRAFDEGKIRFT